MSGIDDLLAEANDRWSRAMNNARDVEDLGMGEAVKTYYLRYFPAGALVLVAAGTVLGTIVFRGDGSSWSLNLAFGLLFAMAGALVGGLVYIAKKVSPAALTYRSDVLLPLENLERKHVTRQIAGKAPIEREHLSVARAGAVQQRKSLARQLVLAPAYVFLFTAQATNWAGQEKPLAWIMLMLVAVWLISIVLLVRDFRRAGRFLVSTSED
ncbi:hypothetical protein AL755_13260 [Arthrobacter sp. ERGS1:01]|uniref:hypothetical protein n=1 Tax=Arthrobacter sp. ERGS1:01 TaxID=1704044 RepID=UPI0006B49C83|nr:hypothetical protein [Arthrobacter sp. ERGS1:01]ALE06207.1 hypothetical protein AL755_13260 [Arthrobacter sp. ERGS1:01]